MINMHTACYVLMFIYYIIIITRTHAHTITKTKGNHSVTFYCIAF